MIGNGPGYVNQLTYAICIGTRAGRDDQGDYCIAIAHTSLAFKSTANRYAISLAFHTAYNNQGTGSVAIGAYGGSDQANNTIAINATKLDYTNVIVNSCLVQYIRNVNGPSNKRLFYSPGGSPGQSGEITWGALSSSVRYKQDIIDMPLRYTQAINELRPVEFSFKADVLKQRHVGLIAEEVAQVVPEFGIYHAVYDTVVEGVDYAHMISMLVKSVQMYRDSLIQFETRLVAAEAAARLVKVG